MIAFHAMFLPLCHDYPVRARVLAMNWKAACPSALSPGADTGGRGGGATGAVAPPPPSSRRNLSCGKLHTLSYAVELAPEDMRSATRPST